MYKKGDLIKIDLTVQHFDTLGYHMKCPYLVLGEDQVYAHTVRGYGTVYHDDCEVQERAYIFLYPWNSKLIERISDD